jgi:hypothetical protein
LIVSEISLSNVGKAVSGVTFRLSITPTTSLPSNIAILIILGGSAPQALSANTVEFKSPSGAHAAASVAGDVLTVQMLSGTFSSNQPISISLPGTVTNAAFVQPPLSNVSVTIKDSSGYILAFRHDVHFRSIIDGSLGNNMPNVMLNDWTAGGVGASMTILFTPSFEIPVKSSVLITLSGSAPQGLSSNNVVFEHPNVGSPTASVSLTAFGVLSVFLQSGTFASGQNISIRLPGTVTNVAHPQSARSDIAAAIVDIDGVVLCQSVTGSMHAIVDGSLNAAINLDWRGYNATSVSFFAAIVPRCDIPSGSSIIFSLAGSAPQILSSDSVTIASPATGPVSATASLDNGVLKVTLSSGSFSSGDLIAFSLPGSITNAAAIQPSLNNISVSIVDSLSVVRSVNRSVFFHAIHDSVILFSHSLSSFSASSVGVKTFGSFKIQGAAFGNVLVFSYPVELFVSSRYKYHFNLSHIYIFSEVCNIFGSGLRVHFRLL